MRQRRSAVVVLTLAVLIVHVEAARGGVVVESVKKDSPVDKAGLRAGDVLLTWEREANPPANPEAAHGELRNPFDAWALEVEQKPRGTVRFSLRRDGERLTLAMPAGNWSYGVKPELEAPLAEAFTKAIEASRGEDLAGGRKQLREIAKDLAAGGRHDLAAWTLARIADARTDGQADAWGRAIMDEALAEARAANDPLIRIELLCRKAEHFASYETENALAESILSQALKTAETIPDSLAPAKVGLQSSEVAWRRGDFSLAESRARRAVAVRERLAPGSLQVAGAQNYLGVFLIDRGKLAEASTMLHTALEAYQTMFPDSSDAAAVLVNIGRLEHVRGDLAAAEAATRRALSIFEKYTPNGLGVVNAAGNLGQFLRDGGDLAGAETFQRRSVELIDNTEPISGDAAISHTALGQIHLDRGSLPAARDEFQKARDIMSKINSETQQTADALLGLGRVALAENALPRAAPLLAECERLMSLVVPGTDFEAEVRYERAQLALRSGRLTEAATRLLGALASLDAYRSQVARSEAAREHFGQRYTRYYRETEELLLRLDRKAEAFAVLERSRARFLLEMLAERDLELERELPADVAAERLKLDAEFDRTQAEIADPETAKDAAKRTLLAARLTEIRAARDRLSNRIRDLSPRLATVRYPRPLNADQALAALDPGETLLAYDVGLEKTFLYLLEGRPMSGRHAATSGLRVVTLPVGEKALRERVSAWQNLVGSADPEHAAALALSSRELYDLLVKPAEAEIARARRLVIVPDGPLHLLPFAALRRAPGGTEAEQYLVEWKPLHRVVSMTVYAELKRSRSKSAAPRPALLVAFGDPHYPATAPGAATRMRGADDPSPEPLPDMKASEAVERGLSLVPLPATRQEVEQLAALYGPTARSYLGEEASEKNAKALGGAPKLIHFACHARVNERFPLDSYLALSIAEHPRSGEDNGLLQAWEVFESLHLDADLVTLSACDSGLGTEMSGEGLVGLTRAFQYAGARSVLPSWWRVEDTATAALMERFYTRLKGGGPEGRGVAQRAARLHPGHGWSRGRGALASGQLGGVGDRRRLEVSGRRRYGC